MGLYKNYEIPSKRITIEKMKHEIEIIQSVIVGFVGLYGGGGFPMGRYSMLRLTNLKWHPLQKVCLDKGKSSKSSVPVSKYCFPVLVNITIHRGMAYHV